MVLCVPAEGWPLGDAEGLHAGGDQRPADPELRGHFTLAHALDHAKLLQPTTGDIDLRSFGDATDVGEGTTRNASSGEGLGDGRWGNAELFGDRPECLTPLRYSSSTRAST